MIDTLIDGRYLLLEVIGSGGEARVFRARDTSTENEVALRLPFQPVSYTPPQFLPEHHSGWIKMLASGIDSQHRSYQIFELLNGQTLGQLIQAGPLEPPSWRFFADQSLSAITALHSADLVHGDLNADNFFLVTAATPHWKMLELPFQRFDPPANRSRVFGSIHTLAPEQIDGAPATVLSDLYSLGCLYYYAASGQYPHPGSTIQEVAIHCLRFPADPLHEKAPHLPATLSDWVMVLLERDPEKRHLTASAAHQLLRIA